MAKQKSTATAKSKHTSKPTPVPKSPNPSRTPKPLTKTPELMDVQQFIEGDRLKPIPLDLIKTEADADKFLEAVAKALGEPYPTVTIEGVVHEGGINPEEVTGLLKGALSQKCITLDDIQCILTKGIEYIRIYRHLFGYPLILDNHRASHYLDLLLFICELYDPKVNRLRKDRRKLYMVNATKEKGVYKFTPEPTVATRSWEKHLRTDERFQNEYDGVSIDIAAYAPYWAFTMATGCDGDKIWVLAFDKELHFDVEQSRNVATAVKGWYDDQHVELNYDIELINLCTRNKIEMLGTPFYPINGSFCPTEDTRPAHFLAQQITITTKNDSYYVSIPSFYRSSHISELLDKDFADVRFVLEKNLYWGSGKPVSAPPHKNPCPLTEKELGQFAKTAWNLIKKHYPDNTPLQNYNILSTLLMKWWPFSSNYYNPTLANYVREPSSKKYAKNDTLPVFHQVLAEMQQIFASTPLSQKERYRCDRYFSFIEPNDR